MSSEIVAGSSTPASPVPWRKVSFVPEPVLKQRSRQRDAEQELNRALDQARREGFEQGHQAGRTETAQQVPSILQNIELAQRDLVEAAERIRLETTRELVRLARKIAVRVLHREMVTDHAAVAGLVRAAFLKLQQREIVRVRMHPAMEVVVSATLQECGAPANLVIAPDSSLAAGDLLFETSQGTLDASLETQLSELERGLIDKLAKARTASLKPLVQ